MIFSYIERSLTRKTHLINILYCTKNQTIDTLALQLNCSPLTVLSDIEYLKTELTIPIEETDHTFQLSPTESENLQCYLKKVYKTSLFLQFLAYFLLKDKPKFGTFVEQQHVSIAKGYRVREEIIQYLNSIHLDIVDNNVVGDTLLIRFFIAELSRSFGINVLSPQPEIERRCNHILDKVENEMNIHFSKYERELYALLIDTSISSDIPNTPIIFTSAELRGINSKLYPKIYIDLVKNELAEFWAENRQEQELKFTIIAFIVTNSHLFDKSVNPEQSKIYQHEFLNLPEVNSLISAITNDFKVQPQMMPYFYTAVYSFLSDSLFNLQPIFTYPVYGTTLHKTQIFHKMSNIIQQWNVFNIEIGQYRILNFCNRLTPILAPNLYKEIVILTEKVIDGNFLRDYLSTLLTDINISVQKDITYAQNFQAKQHILYIIDKEFRIPFTLKRNSDNLYFVFFPIREETLFNLLTKIFKS